MKNICNINFRNGSKEEVLPDFSMDFPHIASYVEFDKCPGCFVPWHWHKEVELFYIEKGTLEYHTPNGRHVFPQGSAGLVNSNVLHMTRPFEGTKNTIQIEHIFDAAFIGGGQGSRIEQKYISPLIYTPQIELIGLHPDNSDHSSLLNVLRTSFELSEKAFAYEIKLRNILSEIWYQLYELSLPALESKEHTNKANDKIKMMMIYISEHFAEKISVSKIADAAYCSERECFRVFHDYLHLTPVEYLKNYRLQKACELLIGSKNSITSIGQLCGLGSSSYFGKSFKEYTGLTPSEYRIKWQNCDNTRQK